MMMRSDDEEEDGDDDEDDDGGGESPCQPVIGPTIFSFIMTGTSMDRDAEHDDGGDDGANLSQKQRG